MLSSTWVPAGRGLTSVRDRTWQMHQDPVELELRFLFIKKKVLGDSILASRCVRSETSQIGGMLGPGAGEQVQHRSAGLQSSEIIILRKQAT